MRFATLPKQGRGFGCYTDDTQMTLALATSLVEWGRVDAAHVSAKYAEFYEAWRGYGGAAHRVMRLLADGGDYRGTGRLQFPEGSFGNGGAMRIAPVGLAYRHADADDAGRSRRRRDTLHSRPPRGHRRGLGAGQGRGDCRHNRAGIVRPGERGPNACRRMPDGDDAGQAGGAGDGLRHNDEDVYVIGRVGNGIRASQAVAAALWAFLRYGKTPEECVIRAVGFGGDTDTIGAMAGALVGALHGSSWIPARWYDNIENGAHGRDEIVAVAQDWRGSMCGPPDVSKSEV